jgi:hypothetical protein
MEEKDGNFAGDRGDVATGREFKPPPSHLQRKLWIDLLTVAFHLKPNLLEGV